MEKATVQGNAVPETFVELARPHVDSFDYFLEEGLQQIIEHLEPAEIYVGPAKRRFTVWLESPVVSRPLTETTTGSSKRLLPHECREMGISYQGALSMYLCVKADDGAEVRMRRQMGLIPIMLKSKACYLRNLSRSQLVALKEESTEFGGTFITNGLERIIRMLIQQRRHYIMATRRSAYHKRGNNYTDQATVLRCVRADETSSTVRCHYMRTGTVTFTFSIRRREFFMPAGVLLKCFVDALDRELFGHLVSTCPASNLNEQHVMLDHVEIMLRDAGRLGLDSRDEALAFVGRNFRMHLNIHETKSDVKAGEIVVRQNVFIHLPDPEDKLAALSAMLTKLWAFVGGHCGEDSSDALTHHEVLLPGQLMMKATTERLSVWLATFTDLANRELQRTPEAVQLEDDGYVKILADKAQSMADVGTKLEYLLVTGNLQSRGGLDLSQTSGFTIVAERLNFFRYLAHFRSIHRGAFFATLCTTAVRKLMPEAWGYLCPVHTPDGAPCGLLNHLAADCRIIAWPVEDAAATRSAITQVLASLGMLPARVLQRVPSPPAYLAVTLDGVNIGHIQAGLATAAVARLRELKVLNLAISEQGQPPEGLLPPQGPEQLIPPHMEVAHIRYVKGGPYTGIYLYTAAARMVRPVRHISLRSQELIGSLEQAFLSVRCPDGGEGGSRGQVHSHAEVSASAMLSIVASLTPFSDYNQSPRNMYQCQMGKQTMGTPVQAFPHRTDSKMYRILTPQSPVARTKRYDAYCMDEHPNGTNMIVAVLAYTSYDMEDAMILNKASIDRGLARGVVYKTEMLDIRKSNPPQEFGADLKPQPPKKFEEEKPSTIFGQKFPQNIATAAGSRAIRSKRMRATADYADAERVGADGLPHVGAVLYPGQAFYSTVDAQAGKFKPAKLKGEEVASIEQVTLLGGAQNKWAQANVIMRIPRNPYIGDKFSSRHGQKGVLSQHYKDSDLPFCASTGMRPDLLINPHAFPSRMTIGMLLESLASKAAVLSGTWVDATPFQGCRHPDEEAAGPDRAHLLMHQFGESLEEAGFQRYGGETMISGVTGEEFAADIFIGPVYYQRLRHMVADKFQVRSTGGVNALTRQPIKGRKMGGGIRFGEMERDALLAHGAAYLLHDRLHTCSDYTVMPACTRCKSLLTPVPRPLHRTTPGMADPGMDSGDAAREVLECRQCKSRSSIEHVALPFIFHYLATELAAMNIKCNLTMQTAPR